jgi:hypothetical protein
VIVRPFQDLKQHQTSVERVYALQCGGTLFEFYLMSCKLDLSNCEITLNTLKAGTYIQNATQLLTNIRKNNKFLKKENGSRVPHID